MGVVSAAYKQEFTNALDDNLNTPNALAHVWDMLKDENVLNADKKATLLDFDKVLGLGMESWKTDAIPEEVMNLVRERAKVKAVKNWARADELRNEIAKLGFEIKDKGEDYEIRKI